MKTINIDDDIYSHLLNNMTDFGETPSSVLRRLLKLEGSFEGSSVRKTEIDNIIESTEFKYGKGVVGRFLCILSKLYEIDPDKFSKVEGIHGRGRLYFAKEADTLHKSGKSVNPKPIPGTEYWVITTTPTDLKQDILRKVLQLYNFDSTEVSKAVEAIAK